MEGPDGHIYNIIRIDGQSNHSNTQNKAAVLQLNSTTNTLYFDQMINFPSTSSKFVIRRDPANELYFTLSTDATQVAIEQNTVFARNHLVLAVSSDLYNWDVCTVVLNDDTGLTSLDSARYTGFHYVDWIFDGPDILMAIRTGYRGADSFHNANRLTTYRLSNYSQFAAASNAQHNGSVCSHDWRRAYRLVGTGWCRPTAGFEQGGYGRNGIDCAQVCTEMGSVACPLL